MAAPSPAPPLTMPAVRAAQALLRNIVPESRMVLARTLSKPSGGNVHLKLESEGPTGSFKVRGAFHAISARQKQAGGKLPGVVTSSTGNHGAAVAYSANRLNIPVRVYLPDNPNPAKRARVAEFGAEITEVGKFLEESRVHAQEYALQSGWYNIVDGMDPDMLPGTATIACEMLERLPQAGAIFVPVGDTTLIRGLAFAAKQIRPQVKIVGVQAQHAPAYALSFAKGHAISTDNSDTIADGLAVRDALEENVRQLQGLVDEFVLVSEDEMLGAMRLLLLEEHVLAEPAGAASTAAFLKTGEAYAGQTVVLLVSGANVSEELLQRALQSR